MHIRLIRAVVFPLGSVMLGSILAFFLLLIDVSAVVAAQQPTVDELLQQAQAAAQAGKTQEAVELCGKAIAAEPKATRGLLLRARILELVEKHEQALSDLSAVVKLDPKAADAYNRRGAVQFKLGRVKESIEDFDKFLELRPEQTREHWMRGISYYYVGRYDEGIKQFEGYQTFDSNDVENAVWRYLCMARRDGMSKAQQEILRINNDTRVPMMQVHALYAGKAKPDDVLAAAKANNPAPAQLNERLFYAHLYLGLYYEAAGNAKLAKDHLVTAAEKHKIRHYMWDVANVHAKLLQGKPAK